MSAFKPSAMLSGGLLARKGTAVPALAEASFTPRLHEVAARERPLQFGRAAAVPGPEDFEPAPVEHPVRGQRHPAKISLRLDPDRHFKLRLAAFHQKRSAQQLLVAALDAYLTAVLDPLVEKGCCACLSDPVPRQ